MKQILSLTLLAFALISCSTIPQEAPSWLNHPGEDDSAYYFIAQGSQSQGVNEQMVQEQIIQQVLDRLGFTRDQASPQALEQLDLLTEQLRSVLQGEGELKGFHLVESTSYQDDSGVHYAILASFDKEAFNNLQMELIPLFPVDIPELDALLEEAQALEDEGFFASAFLIYCKAIQICEDKGGAASGYLKQQLIQQARENLERWDFTPVSAPNGGYSGENFNEDFLWHFPMEPSREETLVFELFYTHPFDSQEMARAQIFSDFSGRVGFNHPPLFKEGVYSLTLQLLPETLAQQNDPPVQVDEQIWQEIVHGHGITQSLTVNWDIRRMPVVLYLKDLDVLGQSLNGQETAEKTMEILNDQGVDASVLQPVDWDPFNTPLSQIHREIQVKLPQQKALLILGETQVKDFNTQEGRVTITGEMRYRLIDLRTLEVLSENSWEKQLDSGDTRGALSGLYSEFSRILADEYLTN